MSEPLTITAVLCHAIHQIASNCEDGETGQNFKDIVTMLADFEFINPFQANEILEEYAKPVDSNASILHAVQAIESDKNVFAFAILTIVSVDKDPDKCFRGIYSNIPRKDLVQLLQLESARLSDSDVPVENLRNSETEDD